MSSDPCESERLAPHSVEAEEAVLGAVLLNPEVIVELATFINVDSFFILRHAWIWEAMERIAERHDEIDNLTLADELRNQGRLDEIGGGAYLTYLINSTPTSLHFEVYGRIVERAAMRRRLMNAASEIANFATSPHLDIDEAIDKAEQAVFEVTQNRIDERGKMLSAHVSNVFDRAEYLMENKEEMLGVPSGFADLDYLTGGWQKGDLVILAGRPGMGKTALMLNMAVYAARQSARVGIFSLEMGGDQLTLRMLSMETGIDNQHMRLGKLNDHEWGLFVQASGKLSTLPIHIDDSPSLTPLELRTKCRRLVQRMGLDLVLVDYLQIMNAESRYKGNRVQEISFISRQLKELARELAVPVIAGAQLSRAVEQRADKRPVLSDLRESGSIEQDADIVAFIYREDMYDDATPRPNTADIIIAKHRNGKTGVASLHFSSSLTKFANLKSEPLDFGIRGIDE